MVKLIGINVKTKRIFTLMPYFTGFFVFIIYLITLSQTVNFWDSGELIASAATLQISHPPGAPLYLLIARLFVIFSFGLFSKALAVNLVSAVFAAITVSLTYLTVELISYNLLKNHFSKIINIKFHQIIIVLSAILASLGLGFSKTFWDIATVAEVYSMSMAFTAIIVYLGLKIYYSGSSVNTEKYILTLALMLGLAVGVHQLVLLVLPFIVLIVWLKRQKLSWKSKIIALISAIFSVLVFQLFIEFLLWTASKFELFFVNSLSFGYNSGLIVFTILLFLILSAGIYYSGIKLKRTLNLILTSIMFFLLGFSIYAIVIIRSAANPPLDQNNPENIFNFISYYSREQYGERPLLYGQQFNSSLDKINPYVKGQEIFDTIAGKYKVIAFKPKANYVKRDKRFLPRMWSNIPAHVAAYREWTKYYSDKVPPADVNFKFMFRYQFSHMYFRYFMWNFVGKQNDFQSHGGPINGNWICGISFIDNLRLGKQKYLPQKFENNPANDAYYFFPLILGLIGIISLFIKDKKLALSLIVLFIMTGIAIAFYLNQHPYQVRERDYSFIGSFFAFFILTGVAVPFIFSYLRKYLNSDIRFYSLGIFLVLSVPGQFLVKNYNDSDKKSNKVAYEFAYNLLNSCDKNAILFVSGDNETFPLWYLQYCEGIRTDVSIINISYLNTDWYIDQIRSKRFLFQPILRHLTKTNYISGQREYLLIKSNPVAFLEDIYYENLNEINSDFSEIVKFFDNILIKNGFDKSRPEEYQNFKDVYSKVQPYASNPDFLEFASIILSLKSEERCQMFGIPFDEAKELNRMFDIFITKQKSYPIPLNACLNFVFSDDKSTKIDTKLYDYPIDYFPATKLSLSINRNTLKDYVKNEHFDESKIVNRMVWEINFESITKGELMIYEIINSNLWQRPIYFSSLMNSRNFMGLEKYLFLEGLAYKLMPVETEISVSDPVNVNALSMYEKVFNKFIFDNLKKQNTYYDENTRNILINYRNHFSRLARSLYFEGEIKKSEEVLDFIVEILPDEKIPYDYYMNGIIHGYYRINKHSKASAIGEKALKNAFEEIEYYSGFDKDKTFSTNLYAQRAYKTIEEIYILSKTYNDQKLFSLAERYLYKAKRIGNFEQQ